MEGDAGGAADGGEQNDTSTTTVYNGSTQCEGCGVLIGPVAAMYGSECHGCRRRRHHRHVKGRMSR